MSQKSVVQYYTTGSIRVIIDRVAGWQSDTSFNPIDLDLSVPFVSQQVAQVVGGVRAELSLSACTSEFALRE